jgi:hypothetical protein
VDTEVVEGAEGVDAAAVDADDDLTIRLAQYES